MEIAYCVKFGGVNSIKKLTLKIDVPAMSLQSVRRAIIFEFRTDTSWKFRRNEEIPGFAFSHSQYN